MTQKMMLFFLLVMCAIPVQGMEQESAESTDPNQTRKHVNTVVANTLQAGSLLANYELVNNNLIIKGSKSVDNNLNVGGSENVGGNVSVAGNGVVGGNVTVSGTLTVGGAPFNVGQFNSCCAVLESSVSILQSQVDVVSATEILLQSQLDVVSARFGEYVYLYDIINMATPQIIAAETNPPSSVSFSNVGYTSPAIVVNSVNGGTNNQIVITQAGLYRFSFIISCYPTDNDPEQMTFGLARSSSLIPTGEITVVANTSMSSYLGFPGVMAGMGQQVSGTVFLQIMESDIDEYQNAYYLVNNGHASATFDAVNVDASLEIEQIA